MYIYIYIYNYIYICVCVCVCGVCVCVCVCVLWYDRDCKWKNCDLDVIFNSIFFYLMRILHMDICVWFWVRVFISFYLQLTHAFRNKKKPQRIHRFLLENVQILGKENFIKWNRKYILVGVHVFFVRVAQVNSIQLQRKKLQNNLEITQINCIDFCIKQVCE